MKKLIYCVLCLLGFGQLSCSDYLKSSAGDKLIPKTLSEYIPVLYAEGYPRTFNTDVNWFKLMTDDVEMGPLEKDLNSAVYDNQDFDRLNGGEGRQAYIWHFHIEDKIKDENWSKRYQNILGCNVVINALPEMTYEKHELGKYNLLAAQAYALRAYHYFCLVNTYALPWSEANLNELGVIIRTAPQIAVSPRERSTIKEVYHLINEDLKLAQEYAANCEPSTNKHALSPAAIQLLATRVALFQENWETVIKMGTTFLQENSTIFNLNTIDPSKMGTEIAADFKIFDLASNNEIIFTFGTGSHDYDFLSKPSSLFGLGFRVSYSEEGSLLKSYDADDLRLKAYFAKDVYTPGSMFRPEKWEYKYHYPIKYKSSGATKGYRENWRTVEVLLNVAEAYARQASDVSEEAIQWINKLRVNRYTTASDKAEKSKADFADKEALVKFIWAERRRELCFEETMRFWDLRRQGMPRQAHKFYLSKTSFETYVLPVGSSNYVLAIPASEVNNNTIVSSNKREEIKPL